MIDKKIYYCWFGDAEMSRLDKVCMESWKKHCPDYEIIKISEENYDYKSNPYAYEAYQNEDWSAVSNAARLEFLRKYGGFYLDTDVELYKSLDELRKYDGGFITEFESGQPDSGVLGCGSNGCKFYDEVFERLVPGTILHKEFIQVMFKNYDIHGEAIHTYDDGFTVIGEEYFPTVRTELFTPNTIGIHYFENTWVKLNRKVTDGFYPWARVVVRYGEAIIHEDQNADVEMIVKRRRKHFKAPDMLGKMGYFFNPNVVSLNCRDFEAYRINRPSGRTKTTVTASGLIVKHL